LTVLLDIEGNTRRAATKHGELGVSKRAVDDPVAAGRGR